jgi:hypothetical protein
MNQYYLALSPNQIHLLKIIYKFRFVTADLVADYRGGNKRDVNRALTLLLKQEYVSRRYDSSYKLLGKGARYYLAPKALKLLRDEHGLNEDVLHARYKDKSVGEPFAEHTLGIFRAALGIRAVYPDTFDILTRAEMAGFDYFPQNMPDLSLHRIKPSKTKPNDYLIDIYEDPRAFIIQKRVDQYIEHFEDGAWGDDDYPMILLVCPNKRLEAKLDKYIEDKFDDNYLDDMDMIIRTTSPDQLTSKIDLQAVISE